MDTGKPQDSSTPKVRTEVEVHPKSSTPRPESPRKETPILSKLVTVGRKESGRSAGRRTPKLPVAVKEADFPDGPPEEEEPIVTNVSPKISKYIPRNLRESAPIEIHSKPKVLVHMYMCMCVAQSIHMYMYVHILTNNDIIIFSLLL